LQFLNTLEDVQSSLVPSFVAATRCITKAYRTACCPGDIARLMRLEVGKGVITRRDDVKVKLPRRSSSTADGRPIEFLRQVVFFCRVWNSDRAEEVGNGRLRCERRRWCRGRIEQMRLVNPRIGKGDGENAW